MVVAYTTKTVKTMDQDTRDRIINSGIPISAYTTGIAYIGADNRSQVNRASILGTKITDLGLPIPPSRLIEFIAERTTNEKSKRDYRIAIDGAPGDGKSRTALSFGCRYGMSLAEIHGQDPKDWFSLDNCALLQDADGVVKLMDEVDKYQCVVIDDAGVSAGVRNWNSPENKALGAVMQTCRTKRWFLIYTSPSNDLMDKQVRTLVYAKGYIYKPCHAANFNLVKINSTHVNRDPTKGEYRSRFSFDDHKLNFYAAFSTDLFDCYPGLADEYDHLREKAGSSLIHDKAVDIAGKNDPKVSQNEKKWQTKMDKYYPDIVEYMKSVPAGETPVLRKISLKTGLTDRDVVRMVGIYNNGGV